MNPQTNKLFAQALDTAVPETWTTLTPQQLTKFAEKFSELLVRDCANKAFAGIGPGSLDAYDRGWQNGRNSAAIQIKEYFGVEE
jgi:hypothetical protein